MTDSLPCRGCGARNRAGAAWCTQCYESLAPEPAPVPAAAPAVRLPDPPTAPPPAAPPSLLPLPDEAPPAAAPEAEATVLDTGGGRFRTVDDGVEWRCEVCDDWNVIERTSCTVCSAPFLRTDDDATVRPVDPTLLLAATVALPGAGHALLGLWGQAFFRGLLTVVWGLGGLSLLLDALRTGQPLLPALPLLLGWLALVGTSANDVLVARSGTGRVLLEGRVLLWLVLGVIGATVGAAFLSAFAAVSG